MPTPFFMMLGSWLLIAISIAPPLVMSQKIVLPPVPGAVSVAFPVRVGWQVRTVPGYFSENLAYLDPLKRLQVKRAVIMVHGLQRNADDYYTWTLAALDKASKQDWRVSRDSVAIFAPKFVNPNIDSQAATVTTNDNSTLDARTWPFPKIMDPALDSNAKSMVWQAGTWISGYEDTPRFAGDGPHATAFEVLDQLVQYFDNKLLWPNMRHIVIAGHSAGAQQLHRYASLGNDMFLLTSRSYWIANPGSYLWYNGIRPFNTSDCPNFDNYRWGLGNYTMKYGKDLVRRGKNAVIQRWQSRTVTLSHGNDDTGDASRSCEPYSQGATRDIRMAEFLKAFPAPRNHRLDYIDGVGHDGGLMPASQAGLTRLFYDNFNGDGRRAGNLGKPAPTAAPVPPA